MKKCISVFILIAFLLCACSNQPREESSLSPNVPVEYAEPVVSQTSIIVEYLDSFTIDEGYHVVECVKVSGLEFEYVVYEMKPVHDGDNDRDKYWMIVVIKNGEVFSILRHELSEYTSRIPDISSLVVEIDVDFDGNNDVLLDLGSFGAQGLILYDCYLQRDSNLEKCLSFSDISNPAVDAENKVILSSWRNSSASHSWAKYHFIDGEYIEMERLTEALIKTDDEELTWTWSDEIFINGRWQLREYFTENDYDHDTLYSEKIYGETAYWDITNDRWRAIFNNGMMSDFSIYSSEYVDTE